MTPLVLVDAFADAPFEGNPAAVCLLDVERSVGWMQALAAELNQSETAFVRRLPGGCVSLRWFTPTVEEELCGHATLAAAHVLWESGVISHDSDVHFDTRSGALSAHASDDGIELDFPTEPATQTDAPAELSVMLGARVIRYGRSRLDHLVELEAERDVAALTPDLSRLAGLAGRGVIVTARAERPGFDFVSRFFAPSEGIPEDPVTGSAHCTLAPWWSERLGRRDLVGRQLSKRGGTVRVRHWDARTILIGSAVTVMRGSLNA
jgi:PhzF family phenazine biosynthesis protein